MNGINEKWGAWSNKPEPIRQEEVIETISADIIVVGAGISGVTCALRAAQTGSTVLVCEKSDSWVGRGGNIGVANSSFMKSKGFEYDVGEIAREWIKRCGNRCDEGIVWLYLSNSNRAMDWLCDIVTKPEYGARPELQGCVYNGETYREIFGSHRFFDGPMAKKGSRAGAADAVYAMYTEAVKLGVQFLFNAPATQLLSEGERVTGVYVREESDDGYLLAKAHKAVVLATGGIGGNADMCEDLAPLANRCAMKIYWPKDADAGDGHRMGLWAGGTLEDPPFPMILHPQAFLTSNYCFLFVKQDGTRFMNEDNYIQGKSIAILRERMTFAWSIIDSAWREKVPPTLDFGGGIFWGQDCAPGEEGFDPDQEQRSFERGIERGVIVVAETPEELAIKMEVPVDVFLSTFIRYNQMVALGTDKDFGKRKELLIALDEPPYYGIKFGPALLSVVGGLRVDTKMRVLGESGRPVDGLYAIGNAMGGRYGVDYPMMIPGNSNGTALTYGYLLGEQISNS